VIVAIIGPKVALTGPVSAVIGQIIAVIGRTTVIIGPLVFTIALISGVADAMPARAAIMDLHKVGSVCGINLQQSGWRHGTA
jgi:hypothetical protein